MRCPGRALEAGEFPPTPVLGYVARQLGVAPDAFADYARRDQTRREHLVEIRRSHGFRIFDRDAFREVVAFSIPIAPTIIHPGQRSEEHTSELQSLMRISYAVFCLKKKQTRSRQPACPPTPRLRPRRHLKTIQQNHTHDPRSTSY